MSLLNPALLRKTDTTGTSTVPSPTAAPTTAPIQNTQQSVQPQSVPQQANPPHGKFFSGNLLEKAFDIPRILEYGAAGALSGATKVGEQQIKEGTDQTLGGVVDRFKGALGGILPGIQNRSQFGTESGDFNVTRATVGPMIGHNKAAEFAGNLGYSLAMPSLPVGKALNLGGKVLAPVSKVVGKIPQVSKVANEATAIGTKILGAVKNSPTISKGLEKLPGLEYFRNPEAGGIIKKGMEKTGQRVSQLFNQVSDVAQGLKPEERVLVGKIIENAPEAAGASPKLVQRANYIRQISDEIGQELVNLGAMKPETFAKYKGKYLAHIADTVKNTEMAKSSGGALNFFLNTLKKREGKLGGVGQPDYIREFQFPVFKSLAGEISTAESARAIKSLAEKFGQTGQKFQKSVSGARQTASGMVNLADNLPAQVKHLVKGVAVPQEVADYVARRYSKATPSLLSKVNDRALSFWKAGKTIYSGFAYHVRNLLSNQILADFTTGAGLPATLAGYGRAVKAYLGKGSAKDMAYLQEMKDAGVIGRQTMSRGLEELKPGVFGTGKSVKEIVKSKDVIAGAKGLLNAPKDFQRASEETAKLNVYTWFREHGSSVEEAAKKAEEAIFSPYNISQTERGLTKNIIPFYSFARQAAPLVAKTYVKNPGALTKYDKFKTAVEGLSPNDRSTNLPESMSGAIRLPIKDKQGNNAYFDPTYIYPHGNFTNLAPEQGKGPLGLGLNPLLTELMAQTSGPETNVKFGPVETKMPQGFDQYFQQPIAKSNVPTKAGEQKLEHAARTFLPTEFSTKKQLETAFSGQPDYAGRSRSKVMAILNAFGIKTSIFRPQDQAKFDKLDVNAKVKSIDSEYRSVLKNQSIPAKDKLEYTRALNEERTKILRGKY